MFNKINVNQLFKHKSYGYTIDIKNRIFVFLFDFIYSLFITKLETLKKYLNNNVKKFIVFFSLFTNAFIMFITKKNEYLRLCVDYKNLDFIIIENQYFILVLEQLLNCSIETAIFI